METPRPSAAAAHAGRYLAALTGPGMRRYGTAALLAIGAIAVTRALAVPLAGAHFVLPLAAVFLSGLLGGVGPGLFAAALSVAGYFPVLSHEAHSYWVAAEYHQSRLVAFACAALLAATTTGWLRSV